ncbi:MAG: thioredoxin family protein [Gammaproteobacteria bacterium]|nr:thioredoxin family protein [Gammaproteobacteria bacterium]
MIKTSIFLAALLALFVSGPASADPRETLLTRDLADAGARAAARDIPIVLLMSASYCGYCDRVRDEFLVPMIIGGDYAGRALLRELAIDGPAVRDFDGARRGADVIAQRYAVSLVPTLLFLDGEGRELARRMVGLGTVDFYGAYLERAVETAEARLATPDPAP